MLESPVMPKNPHAVALGRKGGKSRSPEKLKAVRKNVRKAIKARKKSANPEVKRIMKERGVTRQRAHQILKEQKV